MKLKTYGKVLSGVAVSALLLSACNSEETGGKKNDTKKPGKKVEQVDTSKFPRATTNKDAEVENGHVTFGQVSDTPFEGILNWSFYEGTYDADVLEFFDEALLHVNEDFVYDNEGAATYELSNDNKTVTLTIKDNVKWHDGQPVTGEDLEFAYEVIGHKDYAGPRYDSQMAMIEGMEEYNKGKAKKISGIKVDGNKISITFKEANPSVKTGLWTYPMHKKYLGDIPVAKMAENDKIRKKPIGFGPFKVKSITQGEAVEFERFDDYWKGKPKLASATLKVVNNSIAVKSLENGDIDIASPVSADQYDQVNGLKNTELLGFVDLAYTYIGFKFGKFDGDKGEAVMSKEKFQNKQLRQAMAYAINNAEVGEKMYKGLRFPANTVVPTALGLWNNENVKGYTYDPEKAKALLDEAGYKDTNGDGMREDPEGKEFKINFSSMSGGDIAEPLAKYYIQQWNDVGLDVQLKDGRLQEFNSFYEALQKDDQEVDIYQGAWGTGSDPDPSGIWSKKASYNYTRWVNEESEELLKQGISPKAFDNDYRKEVYDKWQELVHEEAPIIPTLFRYTLDGANKRVTGYDALFTDWSQVGVSADKPVK